VAKKKPFKLENGCATVGAWILAIAFVGWILSKIGAAIFRFLNQNWQYLLIGLCVALILGSIGYLVVSRIRRKTKDGLEKGRLKVEAYIAAAEKGSMTKKGVGDEEAGKLKDELDRVEQEFGVSDPVLDRSELEPAVIEVKPGEDFKSVIDGSDESKVLTPEGDKISKEKDEPEREDVDVPFATEQERNGLNDEPFALLVHQSPITHYLSLSNTDRVLAREGIQGFIDEFSIPTELIDDREENGFHRFDLKPPTGMPLRRFLSYKNDIRMRVPHFHISVDVDYERKVISIKIPLEEVFFEPHT